MLLYLSCYNKRRGYMSNSFPKSKRSFGRPVGPYLLVYHQLRVLSLVVVLGVVML